MLVSTAFAQTASATGASASGGGGSVFMQLLPIILIFFIFYFLILRPQQKRINEHRKMINELQRGDKVVTGGGLIATVRKVVNDEEVMLEIAEGVQVKAVRSTIMAIRDKTPVTSPASSSSSSSVPANESKKAS